MKKVVLTMALTILLSGCAASTTSQSLSEKLEGKVPEQRKEVLRLACLNEAEWPIVGSSYYARSNTKVRQHLKQSYNLEVSEMKALCRKMDALTDSTHEEIPQPKALAAQCAEKIIAKTKKGQKGASEHVARIQRICDEMTGETIGQSKQ